MITLNIFHIVLHAFECLLIWGLIIVQSRLLQDYNALKGWIEFGMGLDLDHIAKNLEKWEKENV